MGAMGGTGRPDRHAPIGTGVRWDTAVGAAAASAFKTSAFKTDAQRAQPMAAAASERPVQIRVRLFGALAALCAQRSLNVELPGGSTLASLLAVLTRHYDPSFLIHIVDSGGAKRRHCRLFVSGSAVEDLQTRLYATTDPTEIDIILLIAPEGG